MSDGRDRDHGLCDHVRDLYAGHDHERLAFLSFGLVPGQSSRRQ